MKRWHEEELRTEREWRKHYLIHVESNIGYNARRIGQDPYEIDCVCDGQIGRFRKRKNGDCGKSKCRMCHYDKFPKRHKTRAELRADLELREWNENY